jgi:nucleotide-binding universal stress UspA family protein
MNDGMAEYRILVALDLKEGVERLLAEVERYAVALKASVDIIHVAEPDPDFVGYIKAKSGEEQRILDPPRETAAHHLREEHRRTQEIGATLRAKGLPLGQALTVQGQILPTILREAARLKSDLVIVGSHQHGALYRLWYGDVAKDAIGQMPCSLLVVPV